MNRREFVQRMFAAGLVTAAPKLIFDIGKNAGKYPLTGMHPKKMLIILDESFDRPFKPNPEWETAPYEEVIIMPANLLGINIVPNPHSRRRFDSNLKEVFPFTS